MPAAKKRTRVNPKAAGDVDRVLGETIRRLRLEAGMSQSVLGAAAHVTFQQVQKYEKGTNGSVLHGSYSSRTRLTSPSSRCWMACQTSPNASGNFRHRIATTQKT